jgi:hypothetical protein
MDQHNSFFILNGPKAGDLIPLTNAPQIRQMSDNGRWIDYEPAPAMCCWRLGPCVMLLGTKIARMPSGNLVLAHHKWVRTLLNPSTGEIRECEFDQAGAGYANA